MHRALKSAGDTVRPGNLFHGRLARTLAALTYSTPFTLAEPLAETRRPPSSRHLLVRPTLLDLNYISSRNPSPNSLLERPSLVNNRVTQVHNVVRRTVTTGAAPVDQTSQLPEEINVISETHRKRKTTPKTSDKAPAKSRRRSPKLASSTDILTLGESISPSTGESKHQEVQATTSTETLPNRKPRGKAKATPPLLDAANDRQLQLAMLSEAAAGSGVPSTKAARALESRRHLDADTVGFLDKLVGDYTSKQARQKVALELFQTNTVAITSYLASELSLTPSQCQTVTRRLGVSFFVKPKDTILDRMKTSVSTMAQLGLTAKEIGRCVVYYPKLFIIPPNKILRRARALRRLLRLNTGSEADDDALKKLIRYNPTLLGYRRAAARAKLKTFGALGLTISQFITLTAKFPSVFNYSELNIHHRVQFLTNTLGLNQDEIPHIIISLPQVLSVSLHLIHLKWLLILYYLCMSKGLPVSAARYNTLLHARVLTYSIHRRLIPRLAYVDLMSECVCWAEGPGDSVNEVESLTSTKRMKAAPSALDKTTANKGNGSEVGETVGTVVLRMNEPEQVSQHHHQGQRQGDQLTQDGQRQGQGQGQVQGTSDTVASLSPDNSPAVEVVKSPCSGMGEDVVSSMEGGREGREEMKTGASKDWSDVRKALLVTMSGLRQTEARSKKRSKAMANEGKDADEVVDIVVPIDYHVQEGSLGGSEMGHGYDEGDEGIILAEEYVSAMKSVGEEELEDVDGVDGEVEITNEEEEEIEVEEIDEEEDEGLSSDGDDDAKGVFRDPESDLDELEGDEADEMSGDDVNLGQTDDPWGVVQHKQTSVKKAKRATGKSGGRWSSGKKSREVMCIPRLYSLTDSMDITPFDVSTLGNSNGNVTPCIEAVDPSIMNHFVPVNSVTRIPVQREETEVRINGVPRRKVLLSEALTLSGKSATNGKSLGKAKDRADYLPIRMQLTKATALPDSGIALRIPLHLLRYVDGMRHLAPISKEEVERLDASWRAEHGIHNIDPLSVKPKKQGMKEQVMYRGQVLTELACGGYLTPEMEAELLERWHARCQFLHQKAFGSKGKFDVTGLRALLYATKGSKNGEDDE